MSTDNTDRIAPQTPGTSDGVGSASPTAPTPATESSTSDAHPEEMKATVTAAALFSSKSPASKVTQASQSQPVSSAAIAPATAAGDVGGSTGGTEDDTAGGAADDDVDTMKIRKNKNRQENARGSARGETPEVTGTGADSSDDTAVEATEEVSGETPPMPSAAEEAQVGTFPVGRPALERAEH